MRLSVAAGLLAVVALALASSCGDGGREGRVVRFATFNIENFPHSAAQIDGAFELIGSLGVDFVGVQEIIDTELFREHARRRLGASWEFVHSGAFGREYPKHRTGVLFDTRRFTLRSVAAHEDTRTDGGGQPVLDVRLAPVGGGRTVRVVVIHFRPVAEGRPRRVREHAGLARVLRDTRVDGEDVYVMGDFNATEPGDREDLAALAASTKLTWATEALACSAFWRRPDDCPTSRLDHVLTSTRPRDVRALGACSEGCQTRDQCPAYREDLSDHCPVVVTVPAPAR